MASTLRVRIVGDTDHLRRSLAGATTQTSTFSRKMAAVGRLAAVGFAAVGAAAVGAGVALFKVGQNFDKAYDTIRVGSGATGKALAGLKDDFKQVVKSVPTDFESASTAVADLNTRLGLSGKTLQEVAKRELEIVRMTGGDLSTTIERTSRVFGDWSVKTGHQAKTLDLLFRASQATGPSVERLSEGLVKYGAPLRQLGFTIEESAAMLGKFEKEGVNTELVLGSMRIALGKMARNGEDAQSTFKRVTGEIKNAGSVSEANAKALELFGARAGPDMAAAIREGRFDLGKLFDTVKNGKETVLGAAKDTESFSEKWIKFKNKVLVAVEPIATRVFEGIGKLMDWLAPLIEKWIRETVIPAIQDLMKWFEEHEEVISESMKTLGKILGAFFRFLGEWVPKIVRFFGDLISAGMRWSLSFGRNLLTMRSKFLEFAEKFLVIADKALGWIPGWGEKFKKATDDVREMRKKTNEQLALIKAAEVHFKTYGFKDAKDQIAAVRGQFRELGVTVGSIQGNVAVRVDGAAGGWKPMADGGVLGRDRSHVAQIAPAGAMRLWAEPETGGEAYIPLAPSKRGRSVAILEDVAQRFGLSVVDYALGGINATATSSMKVKAMPQVAGIVALGRALQRMGFRVSEHPAFGGVNGVHTSGSYHYRNRAIDFNYGPPGESSVEKAALGRAFAWIRANVRGVKELLGPGDANHSDHGHAAMKNGGVLGGSGRSGPLVEFSGPVSIREEADGEMVARKLSFLLQGATL